MPAGDGTGPWGAGPMTGRGAGLCAGNPTPGYMNPVFGRGRGSGWGRGFGRGRGFGWGRGFFPFGYQPGFFPPDYPQDPRSEVELLEQEAKMLAQELQEINNRLDSLQKGKKQEK